MKHERADWLLIAFALAILLGGLGCIGWLVLLVGA